MRITTITQSVASQRLRKLALGFTAWSEPQIEIRWPGFIPRQRPYDYELDGAETPTTKE